MNIYNMKSKNKNKNEAFNSVSMLRSSQNLGNLGDQWPGDVYKLRHATRGERGFPLSLC